MVVLFLSWKLLTFLFKVFDVAKIIIYFLIKNILSLNILIYFKIVVIYGAFRIKLNGKLSVGYPLLLVFWYWKSRSSKSLESKWGSPALNYVSRECLVGINILLYRFFTLNVRCCLYWLGYGYKFFIFLLNAILYTKLK